MKKLVLLAAIFAALVWGGAGVSTAFAEEDHDHDHGAEEHEHQPHDEEEGHGHDDAHEHDDHDDHEQDEHGHDEHEEGKTDIAPNAAAKAGVKVAVAGKAVIDEHITLTGRISQNRNTTVSVPARFPSIVKDIHVSWGQKVKKGQQLAQLESRNNLTPYAITAPKDGVVLERNVNTGDLAEDEALFVIADLSDVWAEFHVFPRDLALVKEALPVHVKALESNHEDTAPISIILPTADAYSQTVLAVVTLPNKEGKWRPGMTVEGDVHLDAEGKKVLVVEETAVQLMEDDTVVFIEENGTYEARHVKLGKRDGTKVEVLEGLKEGERYVAEGSFVVKADIGKHGAGHDHAH